MFPFLAGGTASLIMRTAATLFLLFIALTFGCQAQPQSRQGILFTKEDVQVWRHRARLGPFRERNDKFQGSPEDWERINRQAEQFRRDPLTMEKTTFAPAQIWKGWDEKPGKNIPVWEGIGLQSAAFAYMLFPDSAPMKEMADAVVMALRFQLRQPNINSGDWGKEVDYEHGFKDAIWMTRLILAADFMGDRMPRTLNDSLKQFVTKAARRYVRVIQEGPIGQCFPGRQKDDYVTVGRDALPNGAAYGKYSKKGRYPDGGQYTHVNPNGSLGNHIPNMAKHWNNRLSEKMCFVMLTGFYTGQKDLVEEAVRWNKEWLTYSVFPDGTLAEYERNGDYGNQGQGAWYGALITQNYLLLAEALRLRGDNRLYTFSTTGGKHGTEVPKGGKPKDFRLVLNRMAEFSLGRNPIYHLQVQDSMRIGWENSQSHRYAPWDMQLALANRYYRNPAWKDIYLRRAPGTVPVPLDNLATAYGIWFPWGGTGAELPGFLFMYSEE